jgi:hypothetical protein
MGLRRIGVVAFACAVIAGCVVQSGYGTGAGYSGAGVQPAAPTNEPRAITFNGVPASERDLATVARLEQQWRQRVPSGDYWYDDRTGAVGRWGGPTLGMIPAGLGLGGPLPPNASGGGNGMVTGVFINGRELHPYDVQVLQSLIGTVYRGRWVVDAQGNFGLEGGPLLGNLYALARQAQQRGNGNGGFYYKNMNGSVFGDSSGCVQSNTKNSTYMSPSC